VYWELYAVAAAAAGDVELLLHDQWSVVSRHQP
jgi:hypothetical protein